MRSFVQKRTRAQLQKFGLTMAIAFAILAAIGFWRSFEHAFLIGCLVISALFSVTALAIPSALRPIERAWLAFGERLGLVMSFVILTLLFVTVLTPLGLLLRLFRKDLLDLRLTASQESYWLPVEKDGPGTRPFTPY